MSEEQYDDAKLAVNMSLRDYFAGQALAAFGNYSELFDRGVDGLAKITYEVADAMLKARVAKP